ncbi:MAG: hypothetical protein HY903_08385 [Deltaproteobacteria bacterium]|nr:hypothetical protein [Deltaproteobacteria bacterium]
MFQVVLQAGGSKNSAGFGCLVLLAVLLPACEAGMVRANDSRDRSQVSASAAGGLEAQACETASDCQVGEACTDSTCVACSDCTDPSCRCAARVILISYDQNDEACQTTACYQLQGMAQPEVSHWVVGTLAACDDHLVEVTLNGDSVAAPDLGDFDHPECDSIHGVKFDRGIDAGDTVEVCLTYDRIYPQGIVDFEIKAGSTCTTTPTPGVGCLADDAEVCDARDNNCNGEIDEGNPDGGDACGPGEGECAQSTLNCVDGELTCEPVAIDMAEDCGNGKDDDCDGLADCDDSEDCDAAPSCCVPSSELCDGVDNDCDGEIDEDVKNACGACGEVPAELCDGVDNDCDGEIDDGVTNACGACGEVPAELCDGADNDCDGQIDENVTNICGACGEVPAELCDGADNDCDGEIDEGVKNACGACGAVPVEVCDGRDNDCDGAIDEGVTNICGACGAVPVEVCDGRDNDCDGQIDEGVTNICGACGAVPVEVCDGRDNDCDGQIDENVTNICGSCGAVPAEVCDGKDNDCDGKTDEGVKTTSTCTNFYACNRWSGAMLTNGDRNALADQCMTENPNHCSASYLSFWCHRAVDGGTAWDRAHRDWVDARCSGTVVRSGDTFSCYQASSCTTYTCTTPLVLVFDPEAPVSYNADDGAGSFNLAAAGEAPILRTDWPTAATPWLAYDRDGDGSISSGEELFGSATPVDGGHAAHGFEALATMDDNQDGVVDGLDSSFTDLVAWADLDGDRISTPDELEPVGALGIVSLELDYSAGSRCDARGNCEGLRARFFWVDTAGHLREGAIVDVYLQVHSTELAVASPAPTAATPAAAKL